MSVPGDSTGVIHVTYKNLYDTDVYDPTTKDTREDDNNREYGIFLFPTRKTIIMVFTESTEFNLYNIKAIERKGDDLETEILDLLSSELSYKDYQLYSFPGEEAINIINNWDTRLGVNFTADDRRSLEEARVFIEDVKDDFFDLSSLVDRLDDRVENSTSSSSVVLSDDSLDSLELDVNKPDV